MGKLFIMNFSKESIISAVQEYYEALKNALNGLDKYELSWKPSIESNNIIFLNCYIIINVWI